VNDRGEIARRNGALSKGPRSAAGRARSALNAIRHGLRARAVILPGLEVASDWEDHIAAVAGSLGPTSYVEEQLVERIALQLWRLRRAARAEQAAALASAPDWHADRRGFEKLVAKDEVVAKSAAALEELRALRDGRRGQPLDDDAPISSSASVLACAAVEIEFKKVAKTADGTQTAGTARAVIRHLAELCSARDRIEADPSGVLELAIAHAEIFATRCREVRSEIESRHAAQRVAAVAGEYADLIRRYEVSVERSLFRTLALLRSERENASLEAALVEAVPQASR
jgi:hypothetical protein